MYIHRERGVQRERERERRISDRDTTDKQIDIGCSRHNEPRTTELVTPEMREQRQ